jgi:hypothetical protein
MKKKRLILEAILPFAINRIKGYEVFARQALDALTELEGLSEKITFEVEEGCAMPLKIFVSSIPPKKFKQLWVSQHRSFAWEYKFLTLAVQVEIDISPEARKGISFDGKCEKTVTMPISVFVEDAAYSLGHKCKDLFLCLTIARPGSVRLQEGALYSNGKFCCRTDGIYGGLEEAVLYVNENLKWPEIKTLPIMKVWEWIGRLKGFNQGIGKGPIGRAVAALSYLAIDNNLAENDLDIVWALMGLEALYCEGNSGVMSQLLEKCQVLLGPIERDKKLVREM